MADTDHFTQGMRQAQEAMEKTAKLWQDMAEKWMSGSFTPAQPSELMSQIQSHMDAHLEVNRNLAKSMQDIAQRQQDLMMEIASSLQAGTPKEGKVGEFQVVQVSDEQMDKVFEKASALIKQMGDSFTTAQTDTLGLLRRYANEARTAGDKIASGTGGAAAPVSSGGSAPAGDNTDPAAATAPQMAADHGPLQPGQFE